MLLLLYKQSSVISFQLFSILLLLLLSLAILLTLIFSLTIIINNNLIYYYIYFIILLLINYNSSSSNNDNCNNNNYIHWLFLILQQWVAQSINILIVSPYTGSVRQMLQLKISCGELLLGGSMHQRKIQRGSTKINVCTREFSAYCFLHLLSPLSASCKP